jgi:hypothetical protein
MIATAVPEFFICEIVVFIGVYLEKPLGRFCEKSDSVVAAAANKTRLSQFPGWLRPRSSRRRNAGTEIAQGSGARSAQRLKTRRRFHPDDRER